MNNNCGRMNAFRQQAVNNCSLQATNLYLQYLYIIPLSYDLATQTSNVHKKRPRLMARDPVPITSILYEDCSSGEQRSIAHIAATTTYSNLQQPHTSKVCYCITTHCWFLSALEHHS